MPPEDRPERVAFRLSASELSMLTALADDLGISLSDAARIAIREAYRAKFGDEKPRTKKK